MACYMAIGSGSGGGGDDGGCAQGWFLNFDFRFSFFVFRALAHCLIYAAVPSIEDTLTLRDLSPQSALSTTGRASNYYD